MSPFFIVLQRFSVTGRQNLTVFMPCTAMGSAFCVSAELDCKHTLWAHSALPQTLRIPEAPVSSCCSPHMAAIVFPYSVRPRSLFQGCCSLTQEVDLASACSRYLEILSLVLCQGCCNCLLPPSGLALQVSRDDSAISLQYVTSPDQA